MVIADNLDRIVPMVQEDGRSNQDRIFLDRSEQLKSLDCHLVYTVPISMLYSNRAADLRNTYGDAQVLPMIMVQTPKNERFEPGINKVKELIAKRIDQVVPNYALESDVFDRPETLDRLCLMSGGHVRELLLLMRAALKRTDSLPIPTKAVQRAITEARDTYRRTVENEQWEILAEVSQTKRIPNEDGYRSLLFNRCLLEYSYLDANGDRQRWGDVHPLIKGIQEFQEALAKIQP